MPNINFELNLNKHPKDVPNRSLIWAKNVQLSNDLSCLQSEFSIKERTTLSNILTDKYIAGYIPCNKEFILFLAPKNYATVFAGGAKSINIEIYRYKEQGDNAVNSFDNAIGYICYNNFAWHGGKLKGTFTYNIKTHLIIAVGESDTITGEYIPLKTINLGKYGDTASSSDTDLMLNDGQLSLNPELKIPSIQDFNYINGLAYKGWYYFFIRYKINNTDYTKWYDVGYPIFVDELERVQIFNYFILSGIENPNPTDIYKAGFGAIDYISSGSNTCNKTLDILFDHKGNQANYSQYQVGIICSTKTDKRAFKSLDISITNNNFLLNISSLESYDINSLIFQKYNYYDVKTIINYKNRLYISNYKENIIDYSQLQAVVNNLQLDVIRTPFEYNNAEGFVAPGVTVQPKASILHTDYDGSSDTFTQDGIKVVTLQLTFSNETLYKDFPYDIRLHVSDTDGIDNYINLLNSDINDGIINIPYIPRINKSYGKYNLEITTVINASGLSVTYQDEYVCTLNGTLQYTITVSNYYNDVVITPEDNYHTRLKNPTLIPGDTYNFYVHFVNKYGEHSEGIKITRFQSQSYITINEDGSIKIDNNSGSKYINSEQIYIYSLNLLGLNNVQLSDYIGCFLTYEKVQKTVQFCGIFSRYDFEYNYTEDTSGDFEKAGFVYYIDESGQDKKPDGKYKFRFYCNEINVVDVLELNFTKILIEKTGAFPKVNVKTLTFANQNDSVEYNDSCNSIETAGTKNYYEFDIKSAHYVAAHNFSKGNDYRGSYIEIELENPTSFFNVLNGKSAYKAVLLSEESNLYLSENKILIKFTNTFYFNEAQSITPIKEGLPGFCTFNTALIYNNNKVILNPGFNVLVNTAYNAYIKSELFKIGEDIDPHMESKVYVPGICYARYIDYNNYMFESKCFKVLPEIISTRSEAISDNAAQEVFQFINSTIVQPMNSIDLFQNKFGSQDNNAIITYTNHTQDYVAVFDKRVIRSNPIADESFENSWRIFSPEAYKDITENKGNITNIIALGTTMLVHTEHGIFMLDRDNTLQSGDGQTMQLAMPDIFDVDYKEVFASNLGACGLQDPEAWILDEFGYIFYDNDAHRLYKFGSKQIDIIDSSICQYIDKYKPYKVRFVNDSESNRILVDLQSQIIDKNNILVTDELTLSYNYKVNKWISAHDYVFDRGFCTKQMTYFIIDFNNENDKYSKIYLINRGNISNQNLPSIKNLYYSQFDNVRNYTESWKKSNISIIVNDGYELIKTLEYITWKLYKIGSYNNEDTNFEGVSREKIITPYSGYQLQVYNDQIDTGIINIECDDIISNGQVINRKNTTVMNYKKPWWEYNNWNFNYLRNIKNIANRKAQFMSRLYGNYFIINIWFGDENQRVEFETLDCKLINSPTI